MPEYQYPAGVMGLALAFAKYRVEANAERYKNRPDKRRDGQKQSVVFGSVPLDLWTDAVGILGELLVRTQIDLSGRHDQYTVGTLISPSPNDSADLLVAGNRIAVKANEDGILRVNHKAHINGDSTHYAFVHLQPDGYDITYYSHAEVGSWRVVSGKYSSYMTP
jgi:hypothetical protein